MDVIQLAARAHGIGSVPVGSLARHRSEMFPRLGVPADEGWGGRPSWTVPKPLWP